MTSEKFRIFIETRDLNLKLRLGLISNIKTKKGSKCIIVTWNESIIHANFLVSLVLISLALVVYFFSFSFESSETNLYTLLNPRILSNAVVYLATLKPGLFYWTIKINSIKGLLPKNQRLAESDNVKGMSLLNWCRNKMFSKEEFTGNLFQESEKKNRENMLWKKFVKSSSWIKIGIEIQNKLD